MNENNRVHLRRSERFISVNPYNGLEVGRYREQSEEEVRALLARAQEGFQSWRNTTVVERTRLIASAGRVLRDNAEGYARTITLEMGKPVTESRAEIEKCAWVCDYYAENAALFLSDEPIETGATHSFVRHDPIGPVLAIMPWNFPFWQVFRFLAPTITAGNTAILKHAPNVFGCADAIVEVMAKAGFPDGVFQSLCIHHERIEGIIANDSVKAIALTGSEQAGASVAAIAGRHIKKAVLELGGSNSFIVWKDASMDRAVTTAIKARMLNCGQSCIAAKRFILVKDIYDEFVSRFQQGLRELRSGDPMDDFTQVGPLAREDLAIELQRQVAESISLGAELILGGNRRGCFHEPTILGNVTPSMPAFAEETFGPLAAMIRAEDEEHAFLLAEESKYGLGTTVFTLDIEKALSFASRVSDGAYFINELVKSDPRLPFGGSKRSGYGRELSRDGMMEFVNRKTVFAD